MFHDNLLNFILNCSFEIYIFKSKKSHQIFQVFHAVQSRPCSTYTRPITEQGSGRPASLWPS